MNMTLYIYGDDKIDGKWTVITSPFSNKDESYKLHNGKYIYQNKDKPEWRLGYTKKRKWMICCIDSIDTNSEFMYTLSSQRGYRLLYQSVELDANDPIVVTRWEKNILYTLSNPCLPKWEVFPLGLDGILETL